MYQAIVTRPDGTDFSLPLTVRSLPDGFSVTLRPEELPDPALYVDFMPDFAAASEGEEGYLVVRNSLIHFKGHKDGVYDAGYCPMPLFGAKTSRECFAGVITGLWEQHSVIACRKDGVYAVYPRFRLDGVPAPEPMTVEYHLLTGSRADYNGMASIYREYQLGRGACRKLRDRMNEHIEYLLDAPEVRIRMGWKPAPSPVEEQTPETEPPMHVAITFEQAGELLDAFREAGVEKAEICLVGWNLRGHDGRWPDAFPVEEALGGEDALRALIQKGQNMGFRMVCHTNATDCYSVSSVWSEDLPIRSRQGEMQKNLSWSAGRMYDLCPYAGGEELSKKTLDAVYKLGFRGLHYIDVISTEAPRRCFSEKHPCSQREFTDAMRRLASHAAGLFGGFQSEGGFDHMAGVLDRALYVDPHLGSSPNPLIDDNVPLWQLVYHDVILSTPGSCTFNYPTADWRGRLLFFEYGGHPSMYVNWRFLTGSDPTAPGECLASSPEEMRRTARALRQMQDEYRVVAHLSTQAMVHHERAGSLTITTYEDGSRVVCNYSGEDVSFSGTLIPAHDWTLIHP